VAKRWLGGCVRPGSCCFRQALKRPFLPQIHTDKEDLQGAPAESLHHHSCIPFGCLPKKFGLKDRIYWVSFFSPRRYSTLNIPRFQEPSIQALGSSSSPFEKGDCRVAWVCDPLILAMTAGDCVRLVDECFHFFICVDLRSSVVPSLFCFLSPCSRCAPWFRFSSSSFVLQSPSSVREVDSRFRGNDNGETGMTKRERERQEEAAVPPASLSS